MRKFLYRRECDRRLILYFLTHCVSRLKWTLQTPVKYGEDDRARGSFREVESAARGSHSKAPGMSQKWCLSVVQSHRGAIPSGAWCEASPCQLRGFAVTDNDTECLITNNYSRHTPLYILYAKYETAVKQ